MGISLTAAAVLLLGCMALCVSGARNVNVTRHSRPVELTVFYQLTVESHSFFTNELYPTYLFVNGYTPSQSKKLAVVLKPYTTSPCLHENNDEEWLCANTKLHACASSRTPAAILPSDWHRLNFASCAISKSYTSQSQNQQQRNNEECAPVACFDATRLAFCANSVDGDAILNANLKEFNKLKVNATDKPVILFDYTGLGGGEVKVEEQDKGLDNLMALLCDKYPEYVEGCTNVPRVASKKQFRFTDNLAFQLKRRCDYLSNANKIEY